MIVGILKEIKKEENRVAMTPAGVEVMVHAGHTLLVEKNAGAGSGFADEAYAEAGAAIVATPAEIYAKSDMVMHVKEPQASEYGLIRPGQIVFTYLHLAADEPQTQALIKSGAVCIAYETIQKADGSLPLLTPMSEVAGRMAIQQGAKYLEMAQGGNGVLLGGVPGVTPAKVVVLGGGVVGYNATLMAVGLGAQVTVVNRSIERLRQLAAQFGNRIRTQAATASDIEALVVDADLVVGAVLVPGAATPRLVPAAWLPRMRPGSVLVDVAIDQGGCFETSRPTTHDHPTYVVDGVVHYCVANMPGAVPRTATFALNHATLPFVLALADKGWHQALADDPHLAKGLNVHDGRITCPAVAQALGLG